MLQWNTCETLLPNGIIRHGKEENNRMSEFKVTRYKVRVRKTARAPEKPFSIVLLSDLHNMSYGESNSFLLSEIRSQNPEAVFVSGDMLTGQREPQMDAAMVLMKELTKKYPVYYANGNHEQRMKLHPEHYGENYETYSEAIRSFGVHLLENTSEKIEIQRMQMTVWGYEIPAEYYRRTGTRELTAGQITEVLGTPQEDSYHLLLAHNPVYFPAYAAWGADLTLSGHLHGGIIRLPFLGGVVSPQMRLFPKYDRGLFEENGKSMIVSAGLGSHTIRLRVNNPPELVVIDLL